MGETFEYLDVDGDVLVIGGSTVRRDHATPFPAVHLGTEHGHEQTGVFIRLEDLDTVIVALQRARDQAQRLFDAGV